MLEGFRSRHTSSPAGRADGAVQRCLSAGVSRKFTHRWEWERESATLAVVDEWLAKSEHDHLDSHPSKTGRFSRCAPDTRRPELACRPQTLLPCCRKGGFRLVASPRTLCGWSPVETAEKEISVHRTCRHVRGRQTRPQGTESFHTRETSPPRASADFSSKPTIVQGGTLLHSVQICVAMSLSCADTRAKRNPWQ